MAACMMRRASIPANFKFRTKTILNRTLAVTSRCPEHLAQISESWVLDLFAVEKCIGKGETSIIYSARVRKTGIRLALKTYIKDKMTSLNVHQVLREIDIHSSLHHRHVVDMWGAFENEERFIILMELGKGNLKHLVDDMHGGSLGEKFTAYALFQVISALHYLHSINIAHRDVKPENVVVAMDGTLKLADFGLSIDLSKERAVTRVGTLPLMAPEVVTCPCKVNPNDNKSRIDLWYGVKVDMWSCGVMAYELVTGKYLFRGTTMSIIFAITNFKIRLPENMSRDAQGSKHAFLRPTAVWMLNHDFLRGANFP